MDKLKMQSHDVVGSNIQKIAQLFPNCVTERLANPNLRLTLRNCKRSYQMTLSVRVRNVISSLGLINVRQTVWQIHLPQ